MIDSTLDILDFLKKRVIQYQRKKLDDALSKIKFHSDMKKQLEQKIKTEILPDHEYIAKEIVFHSNMIRIWENNAEKITKEMKKLLIK